MSEDKTTELTDVWVNPDVPLGMRTWARYPTPNLTRRLVPVSLDPCLEKREPDEPMFILLGRDSAAPGTIEAWCRARVFEIEHGTRPDTTEEREHIQKVYEKAELFRKWRLANR